MSQPSQQPASASDGRTDGQPDDDQADPSRYVVVTQDGTGVAGLGEAGRSGEGGVERTERNPAELVERPAKVMRIGSMIKQLLEEVRSAPLDEAGRARMAQIHAQSIAELEEGLAPELVDELRRVALPFAEGSTPTDPELRIAQAQLVGWLEGLFHGIQTALVAQQMAVQQQAAQGDQRRALPPGRNPQRSGEPPAEVPDVRGTGQYL